MTPSPIRADRPQRLRQDGGAATVWMVFATVIVLAVAGLVYDGGALISTKRRAVNDAEEAARAGAQAIDVNSVLTSSGPHLDPTTAVAQAQALLAATGATGTATADADSVTVTVTRTQSMTFLQVFGLGDRTATGTATARPRHGFAGP